jgi:SAM-dependent methyltransferase
VGCATGNIAAAFARVPHVRYTGYDVDAGAIALARERYAGDPRFRFEVRDVRSEPADGERYEYILLAGVLHHLDDPSSLALVAGARDRLAPGGSLVVVDPVLPYEDDGRFAKWFLRLEQGQWVRRAERLQGLLESVPGLRSADAETRMIGATPLGVPWCARFLLSRLAQG